MIEASGIGKDARVIDIGAGASTLVDSLLDRGVKNVAVLDLAEASVRHTRARLGARSEAVTWLTEESFRRTLEMTVREARGRGLDVRILGDPGVRFQ